MDGEAEAQAEAELLKQLSPTFSWKRGDKENRLKINPR
jgi:hypothetical protein